jgi:hypothetical protein
MPSVSEKQRKFMGMELAKVRAGKKSKTGMSMMQLRDFATKAKRPKKASYSKSSPFHVPKPDKSGYY